MNPLVGVAATAAAPWARSAVGKGVVGAQAYVEAAGVTGVAMRVTFMATEEVVLPLGVTWTESVPAAKPVGMGKKMVESLQAPLASEAESETIAPWTAWTRPG